MLIIGCDYHSSFNKLLLSIREPLNESFQPRISCFDSSACKVAANYPVNTSRHLVNSKRQIGKLFELSSHRESSTRCL